MIGVKRVIKYRRGLPLKSGLNLLKICSGFAMRIVQCGAGQGSGGDIDMLSDKKRHLFRTASGQGITATIAIGRRFW